MSKLINKNTSETSKNVNTSIRFSTGICHLPQLAILFMTLMEYLTSQTGALQVLVYKNFEQIWVKRFQKYSLREFCIMKVPSVLFSFYRFCRFWIFCSEYLKMQGVGSLRAWVWIRVQFIDDVRYTLSSPQSQISLINVELPFCYSWSLVTFRKIYLIKFLTFSKFTSFYDEPIF